MELHGKYRLGRRLGGGGMADVFRAEIVGAEGFSRPVAIKRLHAAISADEAFCSMFIREARLLSQLHHANIVSVLDFEWDARGQLFLVMELVDGVDLARLAGIGPVPVSVSVHVVGEVLRALVHAHEHQIIHRDVTPHNVMVSWQGEVKLTDFGLAKALMSSQVSSAGLVKGKVQYLSPDQIHGLNLDGRTDLFSVGVMLYELVTGRFPFTGERSVSPTMAESIARMLTGTIVPPRDLRPEVPVVVEEVIMRLLERERERRFASARDALAVLPRLPDGPEELAALLAERFPEREAFREESSAEGGEEIARPHIRGTPGRTGAPRLRYLAPLATLLAFVLVMMARSYSRDEPRAARALIEPAPDAGVALAGPAPVAVSIIASARDAGTHDSGAPDARHDVSFVRRATAREAGRADEGAASGAPQASALVDAAPAPLHDPPDAAPVPAVPPASRGSGVRDEHWGNITPSNEGYHWAVPRGREERK